jgi:hypothetical protein
VPDECLSPGDAPSHIKDREDNMHANHIVTLVAKNAQNLFYGLTQLDRDDLVFWGLMTQYQKEAIKWCHDNMNTGWMGDDFLVYTSEAIRNDNTTIHD